MADIDDHFRESHPPLTSAQAVTEANRCYFCYDAPCTEACPTDIDVPGFIRGIASGNMAGAAIKILQENIFGGSCARVCPTEILCEHACVWTKAGGPAVQIGALQRVATDWQMAQPTHPFIRAPATGKHIAIIGAGPAGLSAAHGMARRGHDVTVYDTKPKPGGLNEYGIAAYKLVDDFAAREIEFLLGIGGITLEHNKTLGDDLSLDDLARNFDAVFLALGQAAVNMAGVTGEHLPSVRNAVDFIAELRQAPDKSALKIPRRVLVIGGGNTAIDAATQAKLLGAEDVTILYRKGRAQMSATAIEQNWALTHHVVIHFHAAPVRIESETGELCVVTESRRYPADLVLRAVGQKFHPLDGLEIENGRIKIDQNHATSHPKIFAGGDCVPGLDLTVRAVQDGKCAARAIHEFLGCD
ncbi:MAG: NAD(P)-dependent oxidoreductase [Acidocella sp.]|nr:NAD(P)-dependent oxidoreductase [Acidocella sp.]